MVLARALTLLHDDRILAEYREVLLRPRFQHRPSDVEDLFDFLLQAGEHVSPRPLAVTLPDASDLPFLEVAVSGAADALVSGNIKDFRPRRGSHGIRVILPAEFLARMGS